MRNGRRSMVPLPGKIATIGYTFRKTPFSGTAGKEHTMEMTTPYAFGKTVAAPFAATQQKVREELQKEGFGILSEIDVTAKFREKLGREFRNYVILGACNPPLAWEAFSRELNIGTLLPCNVVVYSTDDGDTAVMIMDPVAALGLIGNPAVSGLAATVKEKLERVLAAIG
jgi:uncharacterized protein (DUF302 family)